MHDFSLEKLAYGNKNPSGKGNKMIRYFLEWLISRCFANRPKISERESVNRFVEFMALLLDGVLFGSIASLAYWQIDSCYFHRYSSFWDAILSGIPLGKWTRSEQIIFGLFFALPMGILLGLEVWIYPRLKTRQRRNRSHELNKALSQIGKIAERRGLPPKK